MPALFAGAVLASDERGTRLLSYLPKQFNPPVAITPGQYSTSGGVAGG